MRRWGMIVMALVIALSMTSLLAGCSDDPPGYSVKDLPPGDAARGAEAFTGTCGACHRVDGVKSTGPSLDGYGDSAGSRVKGQSAEEYTLSSILRPSKHMVQGFSNVMPGDYEKQLSQQTVADLIAYLLTL